MDAIDKIIINHLQEDFPVCERPFLILADQLQLPEDVLINRVQGLLDDGTLSRFGPLYNLEVLGGSYSLVAMQVSKADIDTVVAIINEYPEVAHNYERDHRFNLWFVLATETANQIDAVLDEIENRTGYKTYNMPKLDEYYVGLKFDA